MHRRAGIRIALAGALAVLAASSARAQEPPAPARSHRPFEVQDNSFFVEEAFNQEPGVVQTIVGAVLLQDAGWATTVTQEWPVPSMRHQLSFTALVGEGDGTSGFGDLAINYRYQWFEEGEGRPAVSPRATLIVPTGNSRKGLGAGSVGLQFNLPVSKQVGDIYLHGNAGLTWYPSASPAGDVVAGNASALTSPFLAASAIYRLRPMFHLMLESLVTAQQGFAADATTARTTVGILSPGFRAGWNHGDTQYVVGVAAPLTWVEAHHDAGAFLYFSYETAFRKSRRP
jgi:hypothetical protein